MLVLLSVQTTLLSMTVLIRDRFYDVIERNPEVHEKGLLKLTTVQSVTANIGRIRLFNAHSIAVLSFFNFVARLSAAGHAGSPYSSKAWCTPAVTGEMIESKSDTKMAHETKL